MSTASQEQFDQQLLETLQEMGTADPLYRPTNFWQLGLRLLMAEWFGKANSLASFKSWTSAHSFFYPTYGFGLRQVQLDELAGHINGKHPKFPEASVQRLLNGRADAERDHAVATALWDQDRWPFESKGESRVGQIPQAYSLAGAGGPVFGRPYLNYMLCLAALSRHVDGPITSALEIGGGFGVLGELLSQSAGFTRYVDADIPPLVNVAEYYLSEVMPDSVDWEATPSWKLPDVQGPFDLFANCYSFQEMEPGVVSNYIDKVAGAECKYIVSLNSTDGKRTADPDQLEAGGVIEPVTSASIEEMFKAKGYTTLENRKGLIRSNATLLLMKRS